MKKLVALFLAVMLIVPAFAMADNVIKIGVFEPSTGDNGAGGKQEILGVEYAHSLAPKVTIGGEEYTVELDIVDNQSVNDKAVSAAAKLASDKVAVVLGSYGSGVCMAAGDTFVDAGIPAIGISCTNPNVTLLCDNYWRICFIDPFQGSVMANFAWQKGCKKAYVLFMQGEDYGSGLANYFVKAFQNLGGEVEGGEAAYFSEGTSDFTAFLTNAKNAGCDVFFAPCSTGYAAQIIEQAASQGVTFPLMAGDTWENSAILNAAKDRNVEVYFSTFVNENDDAPLAKQFVEGYQAWLNANPDKMTNNGGNDIVAAVSTLGFDAYNVALAAIAKADSADPAAIMEALKTLSYEGATGVIEFDENGDAKKDTAFIKYANPETGAFDFVTAQKVEE